MGYAGDGTLNTINTIATGATPGSLAISNDNLFLYCANNGDATISIYSIDQITGFLTLISTPSSQIGTPSNLKISADGNYVYACCFPNLGIAMFTRNSGTGLLSYVATYSAARAYYSCDISLDGKTLYAMSSTTSDVLPRNAATGALSATIDTLTYGSNGSVIAVNAL